MLMQISVILQQIYGQLSKTIVKIVIAILIFLFGFIAGKLLGRIVFKMLKEVEINKFIKNSTGLKINADNLISNILSYAIYFLSLVAALEQIGIANMVLYLLSTAVIIIIIISFFLGIRDFLPNLVSGIYLYGKDLKRGSYVEINGVKGELVSMDILHVKIRTKSGDIIYIPNSVASKSSMKIKKNKPKKKSKESTK